MLGRRMFSFLPFGASASQTGQAQAADGTEHIQLPAAEDAFWHERYLSEPYFVVGRGYDQYQPAYALGWHAAQAFDRSILNTPSSAALAFSGQEAQLCTLWNRDLSSSFLTWAQARNAVKAAWMQVFCPRVTPKTDSDIDPQVVASLLVVYVAGCHADEAVASYLSAKHKPSMGQTLQRIRMEMQSLLKELRQSLPVESLQQHARSEKKRLAGIDLLHDVWRDSGFLQDESVDDIQGGLQTWLNSYQAISMEVLPVKLAYQFKRHMLIIRGHLTAIQWMEKSSD